MNEYARARGKEVKQPAPQIEVKRCPPLPLSEDEAAAVAEKRKLVLQHMPEMVPMIKDLVDAGLIDGWRNVRQVTVLEKVPA